MSTFLRTITGSGLRGVDLDINTFWGGEKRGQMLQLTQGLAGAIVSHDEPGYIQLTTRDAYEVIVELTKWLKKKEVAENVIV